MNHRSRRRTVPAIMAGILVLSVLAACSEDREGGAAGSTTSAPPEAQVVDCATDLLACAARSTIGHLVPDQPTAAEGEPLVLGMINQENTPLGSFPELSSAVKVGAALVNEQLGGVNGRPVQIEVCNTQFSPEGSTACAQQFVEDGVPVVLGGIDVFGNGIATLAENDIPFVGGIPVSTASVTAPGSFQFSGGIWGATIAFAHHAATELGATSVAVVYPEYEPITDAANRGQQVLEAAGISDVVMIAYPITATDLTSPLQAAAAADPEALIMLAADTGCKGAFDGADTVGLEAQMYLVGACASPNIIEQVGPEKTEGTIFNVEGEIQRGEETLATIDNALYVAAAEAYDDSFDPIGAGTVSFRSFMNLWAVLVGLDEITPEAISEAMAAQVETPSFMGHPYTCDGEQLSGLPALCSPQQILARIEGGELVQVGTWVDVGAVPGA